MTIDASSSMRTSVKDKRLSTMYEFLLKLEKKSPMYYKELENELPRIHSVIPFLIEWGLKRGVIEECEPPVKDQRGRGWFYGRKKLPRKEAGRPPQKYYRITDEGRTFLRVNNWLWDWHVAGISEPYWIPKGSKEYVNIKKNAHAIKGERAKWIFLYYLERMRELLKKPQK